MIVGIEGKIELKEPTYLHINVAGVIYEVNISLNCFNSISGDEVKLLISQIIREDSNSLYGFVQEDEKKIFDKLIKINGIGSKVALAVCSTFTPNKFADIMNSKDASMLKKVPGIGPKSANRILVELSDFELSTSSNGLSDKSEAVMALESLGFKRDLIMRALSNEDGDTATLVKKALKKLSKI